jgi:hypothetical protein
MDNLSSDVTMELLHEVAARAQIIQNGLRGMSPDTTAPFHEVIREVCEEVAALMQHYVNRPVSLINEETGHLRDEVNREFHRCATACHMKLLTLELNQDYRRHNRQPAHRIEYEDK